MASLDETQSLGSEIRCPFLYQESDWNTDPKVNFWRLAGDSTFVEESTWGSMPCDIGDSILLIDCDGKLLEGTLKAIGPPISGPRLLGLDLSLKFKRQLHWSWKILSRDLGADELIRLVSSDFDNKKAWIMDTAEESAILQFKKTTDFRSAFIELLFMSPYAGPLPSWYECNDRRC
jgi:hypothetical protein